MANPAQGGSVYNTSANAYNGAVNATGGAMAMSAMSNPAMAGTAMGGTTHAGTAMGGTTQASPFGYGAFTGLNGDGSAMAGFGAGNASGGGYSAAQAAGARDITAGQFAGMDINPYLNPYTNTVVDQTATDMERARLIEQNQADDAMQNAGAFGGSRHGIANAETNRGFYDRLGATTGALRNQGYQTAMQAAFQDIGNTMSADMANQQADLSTNQFNAAQTNQARMTGANNATSASIANAQREAQLAAMRMGAVNDASRFGAQANNTASMFNAGAANDMSRFNAGNLNDTSRFNASANNDMSRFNASNLTDTSRFNAGNFNTHQQQQFGNMMTGASQLGGLANLGFGMGNTISDRQMANGSMARQTQQDLMNAAMQQWAGYQNAGNLGLGNLQSGVASAPSGGGTTTQTQNPGLFGVLGALAGF